MSTKPDVPHPAPAWWVRLALWFGIYIVAQVPLQFYLHRTADHMNSLWAFPMLLNVLFWLLPMHQLQWGMGYVMVWPFVFYIGHLVATVIVSDRRKFRRLIWTLVVVVLINLACGERVYLMPLPD